MKPAIVVNAFNRPQALKRLLDSLLRADYPGEGGVRLILSIDCGQDDGHRRVTELARDFDWPFGPKEVIEPSRHLGLVDHFYFCGELSKSHASIVYLEDDLIVSPAFYSFASQALDFYREEPRLAAVSLYALWFNGYTQQPFIPLQDGADVFFLQVPYTQGLGFTAGQWQTFTDWRTASGDSSVDSDQLHDSFLHFAPDEWFPRLAKFVVETGRLILYPRISLTSGGGDAGTHFGTASVFFQTPLQGHQETYRFQTLDQAEAVYDSFFEILPSRLDRLTPVFHGHEYTVDLYGTKSSRQIKTEYVLTSRSCRQAELSFAKSMWPMEANVIQGLPGNEIFFTRSQDLRWDWLANLETRKRNHDYFTRRRRLSRKLGLAYALLDGLYRLHILRR